MRFFLAIEISRVQANKTAPATAHRDLFMRMLLHNVLIGITVQRLPAL